MLKLSDVKRIVHGPKLANGDLLLVLLALDSVEPQPVQVLKKRCLDAGVPRLAKTNISETLGRRARLVARTPSGWELQDAGVSRVREIASAVNLRMVVTNSSHSLRAHAEGLSDELTRSFVMEAIVCFEAHQYRAAIVFSWAGAVALIQKHVYEKKLDQFNVEASRRDTRWRSAKQQDDLGRMKEHEFLDICEAIGVLGKNVKQILQNECLMLRNACGHPNSTAIAENSVAAHIEKLIKNVFSRF